MQGCQAGAATGTHLRRWDVVTPSPPAVFFVRKMTHDRDVRCHPTREAAVRSLDVSSTLCDVCRPVRQDRALIVLPHTVCRPYVVTPFRDFFQNYNRGTEVPRDR